MRKHVLAVTRVVFCQRTYLEVFLAMLANRHSLGSELTNQLEYTTYVLQLSRLSLVQIVTSSHCSPTRIGSHVVSISKHITARPSWDFLLQHET